jgi:hypothetical protein
LLPEFIRIIGRSNFFAKNKIDRGGGVEHDQLGDGP